MPVTMGYGDILINYAVLIMLSQGHGQLNLENWEFIAKDALMVLFVFLKKLLVPSNGKNVWYKLNGVKFISSQLYYPPPQS